MSKGKKIKIIISIAAISFIQGLQYCVSPVLGQIQEHYPDVNISLVQMLITAPAAAVHDRGSIVRMAGLKDQQEEITFVCQPCSRNHRVPSVSVG